MLCVDVKVHAQLLFFKGEFKMGRDFTYNVDENFNHTIDERGNAFISLRKIQWNGRGDFRLDLRKYINTEDGETMQKGVSFLTEEGPSELAKVLLENDYGNAKDIADVITNKRKDILNEISKNINGVFPDVEDIDGNEEELYDARSIFDE